ncbi:MAG: helix-turn-helix domain-containing protein [Henriciella sp.]
MSRLNVNCELGKKVRAARLALGMSVQELAIMIAMSEDEILEIETGSVYIKARLIAELSTLLNKPVAWFFDGLPGQEIFRRKDGM